MEQVTQATGTLPASGAADRLAPDETGQGLVVTDAALEMLKRLAPAGCVLCALDIWEGEEGSNGKG